MNKVNCQNKINYQLELDKVIEEVDKLPEKPTLLLHSCCGPCSSYVLEYLCPHFDITVFYCNPCIYPKEEYEHRKNVQQNLIRKMNEAGNSITFIESDYDHDSYLSLIKGLEQECEGGERCHLCYRQRLEITGEYAGKNNFEYFTTTLTVSPYKNAAVLNEIGRELSLKYGVKYLFSDFKKREGYKRSIELSKAYDLYRQDYCGCEFSVRVPH